MRLAIVHSPRFDAELPAGHRFPMAKFRRLAEILVEEGLVAPEGFHRPEPAQPAWIELAHDPAYVDQVLRAAVPQATARAIGFPVTDSVARRAFAASGATVLTARLALAQGIACNSAGGSHHAGRSAGAGFCVFNDVAVAIRVLQSEGFIGRTLVVDLDVHQGDGTASIFADDASVFTLSVHAEKNYPVRKARSDLDIGLPDGTGDKAYLDAIREIVPAVLDSFSPNLVFYNAGVDPHAEDRLGRLALTDAGLIERDRFVIGSARERGIALAGVIGGGYSDDIDALARRHAILHRVASEFV